MFTFAIASLLSIVEVPYNSDPNFLWVHSNQFEMKEKVLIVDRGMLGDTNEYIDFASFSHFVFSYYTSDVMTYSENPEDNTVDIITWAYNSSDLNSRTRLGIKSFKLENTSNNDGVAVDVSFTLKELTGLDGWQPGYGNPLRIGFEIEGYQIKIENNNPFIAYSMALQFGLDTTFPDDRYDDGYEEGYIEGEKVGNEQGLKDGYNNGYNDGFAKGTEETNTPSINWLKKLMLTLNDILNIELFPNFRLSYIIGIFIIFPILSWLIHWFK